MKYLIVLVLFFFSACKDSLQHRAGNDDWTLSSIDTLSWSNELMIAKIFRSPATDSFQLRCESNGVELLTLSTEVIPSRVYVKDIAGDSLPELIVSACVPCDPDELRLFFFDAGARKFGEYKVVEPVLGEVYHLDQTDLMYTMFYTNQSGATSMLYKFTGDSCAVLGEMSLPYNLAEPITIAFPGKRAGDTISRTDNDNPDSIALDLWKSSRKKIEKL